HAYALSHALARGNTQLQQARSSIKNLEKNRSTALSRIEKLKGDNVILNNITHGLCLLDHGQCNGYDTRTLKAFNSKGVHLNDYAYEFIEPIYRKTIDKVLELVEKR
ncbi:hypothetical protein PFISCL1PPCAC_15250, partial [Pristionchus fissidentatus]